MAMLNNQRVNDKVALLWWFHHRMTSKMGLKFIQIHTNSCCFISTNNKPLTHFPSRGYLMLQVISCTMYNLLHLAWPLRLTDSKPKTLPKYENNSKNQKKHSKTCRNIQKNEKMKKYKNIQKNKNIQKMQKQSKTCTHIPKQTLLRALWRQNSALMHYFHARSFKMKLYENERNWMTYP